MGESLLSDMPYDDALEYLRGAWPDYYVWFVPMATGEHRFTWCATRNSDGTHFEGHTPAELNGQLQ